VTGQLADLPEDLQNLYESLVLWVDPWVWIVPDLTGEVEAERRTIEATHDARGDRDRKLRTIGGVEVFPAGVVILEQAGSGPSTREVVVAVTQKDFVVLDADVRRDPEGEIGRIGRDEVSAVHLVDENGQPIAMTQSRDVLELDDPPSSRYVVSVDRRDADQITSLAFIFRSLSVADEAKRDFERNIPNTM
jgi:hypothetical protein